MPHSISTPQGDGGRVEEGSWMVSAREGGIKERCYIGTGNLYWPRENLRPPASMEYRHGE